MLAFGSACRDFEFIPTFRFGPFSILSIPCLLFALASFLAIVMARVEVPIGRACLQSYGAFDPKAANDSFNAVPCLNARKNALSCAAFSLG